jgi:lipoprotein-releasing system permease protein
VSLLNRFEILVGLRYLRAKRKQHFISFISFASVVGIVLGVAVLITVTSVFNGFAKEFRERWLAGTPHVRLMNDAGLQNWRTVLAEANKLPGVVGATPNVNGHGLITSSGVQPSGILLIGISPELESNLVSLLAPQSLGACSCKWATSLL